MASFLGGFFICYYVFRQSVWSIYNELRDRSNKAQVSSLPLSNLTSKSTLQAKTYHDDSPDCLFH